MRKTTIWIRVANLFIDQDIIRAIKREGKGTRISLAEGEDIIVAVEYEKIKPLIPNQNKT